MKGFFDSTEFRSPFIFFIEFIADFGCKALKTNNSVFILEKIFSFLNSAIKFPLPKVESLEDKNLSEALKIQIMKDRALIAAGTIFKAGKAIRDVDPARDHALTTFVSMIIKTLIEQMKVLRDEYAKFEFEIIIDLFLREIIESLNSEEDHQIIVEAANLIRLTTNMLNPRYKIDEEELEFRDVAMERSSIDQ